MEKTTKMQVNIDSLIEELKKLDEGMYSNENGLSLAVKVNTKYETLSFDIKNGKEECFDYRINISSHNKYTINKKIDNNSTLFLEKDLINREFKSICTNINNKDYCIYNGAISTKDQDTSIIRNNTLLKKIDDNCTLGYSLDDNKIYVFYKKYNKSTKSSDIDEDYIKFEYNISFINNRDFFNDRLDKYIKKIKNDLISDRFKLLLETLDIPKLNDNLSKEIADLKDLANVYNMYKDKFNIFDNDKDLDSVYSFVKEVVNKPMEARVNSIRNYINKIDLYDSESLKKIKIEIDSLIKYNNKRNKSKRLR